MAKKKKLIESVELRQKQKSQMIRLTVKARADFRLDELDNLQEWKDKIAEYGEILEENVEVVDGN